MNKFLKPLDFVIHYLAYYVGGILLVVLVLVTDVDVTLRKTFEIFGNPLFRGSADFSRLSLLLLVGLSFGYGARTGGNVSVEILDNILPDLPRRILHFVIKLFSGGLLGAAAYFIYQAGVDSVKYREGSLNLNIPHEPFYYALAVGVLIYAIVQILEALCLLIDGKVELLVDESSELTAFQEDEADRREAS